MATQQLKCDNCGGKLQMIENKLCCANCGTDFVLQDEISQTSITNNQQVVHNYYGTAASKMADESKIKDWTFRAEEELKDRQYINARDFCLKVLAKEPQNQYVLELRKFAELHKRSNGRYMSLNIRIADKNDHHEKRNAFFDFVKKMLKNEVLSTEQQKKLVDIISPEIKDLPYVGCAGSTDIELFNELLNLLKFDKNSSIWKPLIQAIEQQIQAYDIFSAKLDADVKEINERRELENRQKIIKWVLIIAASVIAGLIIAYLT